MWVFTSRGIVFFQLLVTLFVMVHVVESDDVHRTPTKRGTRTTRRLQGSNKLSCEFDFIRQEADTYVYRGKYDKPAKYNACIFLFDPSEVYFDSYAITCRGRISRSSSKGSVFADDPSKSMISISGAVPCPNSEGSLESVTITFTYRRGGRPDNEHQDALAKFEALHTKGQFMVLRSGSYEPLAKAPSIPVPWRAATTAIPSTVISATQAKSTASLTQQQTSLPTGVR